MLAEGGKEIKIKLGNRRIQADDRAAAAVQRLPLRGAYHRPAGASLDGHADRRPVRSGGHQVRSASCREKQSFTQAAGRQFIRQARRIPEHSLRSLALDRHLRGSRAEGRRAALRHGHHGKKQPGDVPRLRRWKGTVDDNGHRCRCLGGQECGPFIVRRAKRQTGVSNQRRRRPGRWRFGPIRC